MKRIYKLLLIIILITVCSLSLIGCYEEYDTHYRTYDSYNQIDEGMYSSSLMNYDVNLYGLEKYIQINCNFKKISKSEYESYDKNVLENKKSNETNYFLIEMYIKEYNMEEFSKIDLLNITTHYIGGKTGLLCYKANFTYKNNEQTVTDVIQFTLLEKYRIKVKILDYRLDIFSDYYKEDIWPYELKYSSGKIHEQISLSKTKLSIKEITEKEFTYKSPNQLQALYGKQYLEVELYFYLTGSEEYERATLTFNNHSNVLYKENDYYYYAGDGNIMINGESIEFTFQLNLNYDEETILKIYGDGIRCKLTFNQFR